MWKIIEDIDVKFDLEPIDVEPDLMIPEPEPEEADIIHEVVEVQPEPVGGLKTFYQFVNKNLKYPPKARRMGIEGKVFIQFVIDKDGSLIDFAGLEGYWCRLRSGSLEGAGFGSKVEAWTPARTASQSENGNTGLL